MLKNKNLIYKFSLFIVFFSAAFCLYGAEKPKAELKIDKWLVLGPVKVFQPILNESAPKKFDVKDILSSNQFDIYDSYPSEGTGMTFPIPPDMKAVWKKNNGSSIELNRLSADCYNAAYLMTYLNASEFVKTSLEVRSSSPFAVILDGKSLKEETSVKGEEKKPSKTDLTLEPGFHKLLIKLVTAPSQDKKFKWAFSAGITSTNKSSLTNITITSSPEHNFTIYEILNLPFISNASISFDGKYVLVSMSRTESKEENTERWIELRNADNGSLVRSFRGIGSATQPAWSPESNRFAFVTTQKEESSLWVIDVDSGISKQVLEKQKRFQYFDWSPDGKSIIYSLSTEAEQDKTGLKRIESLRDRQADFRNKSNLYIVSIEDSVSFPVSISDQNSDFVDFNQNNRNVLISKEVEDYAERPYFKTEIYNLNLADMSCELLLKSAFLNSAYWSPDGKKILVLGGPSIFNGLGKTIEADKIPNDYDTQAYIFDPVTKEAEAISKDFNPSINSALWSTADGNIYFHVTEGQMDPIYKYSMSDAKYSRIDVPVQVVKGFDIASKAEVGVCYGTTTDYPARLYTFDTKTGISKMIYDPVKEFMTKIKTGKVEEWDFVDKDGVTITGRLHFPPDFDPSKKYPCIVHYYGGTSPINMDYGGRYPNNWWTALGYIIYVVEPRGSVGFGQEFSTYHVNDWGKYALPDIIEGTEKLLASHPYIDPKRIGCIGASYGGFTTELLIARTDIFAAAVSHAGITSLASYWGGGYWGYEYSGVATAGKFPWNAFDIYIDRSPLYNADKIKTPLLLLHGSADTNVPTHESDYLFTALKLLGREVEYIRVLDQDHWVLDLNKRIVWYKTIMAWFEMKLKGKPDFWENLYPLKRMGASE
jgi:dipeptidyl aminopeptidase/acylaminoacyl peptidase